ncbi:MULTISPECIES: daptide-type RiPP [unclassified Leucobacter]|nr:daptide-type RiPP [Leucobacter sp. cx-42]
MGDLDLSIAEVEEVEAPITEFQAGFGVGLVAVGVAVAIT